MGHSIFKVDDLAKNPSTALRCILRHCDVVITTPHASGFARLVYGAFCEILEKLTSYDSIKVGRIMNIFSHPCSHSAT